MHNHAPSTYVCPICLATQSIFDDRTWIRQADIVYRDDAVMVFIGSKFVPGHEGYPIVVPVQHIENIYDMPDEVMHQLSEVTKRVAVAVRETYGCEGITIVQNNEPAGDQHAFHYHVHVVPRRKDRPLQWEGTYRSEDQARLPFAERLREALL